MELLPAYKKIWLFLKESSIVLCQQGKWEIPDRLTNKGISVKYVNHARDRTGNLSYLFRIEYGVYIWF